MESLESIIAQNLETQRALSVKMRLEGFANPTISRLLNVAESFVSKWWGIYNEFGAAALQLGYKGSESYLSAECKKQVITYIQKKESITCEELIDYLEKEFQVVYKSKQSYYDLLKLGGMSWHKTVASNPKKDEKKVEEKREEVKKKVEANQTEIETGNIKLFFMDECHLNWGNVRGSVWGKRNTRIEIPIDNPKLRQTYYGALNATDQKFHIQAYDAGNGENTVSYMKYIQSLYPSSKIWWLWDGAKYHLGENVKNYLKEVNDGLEPSDWKVECIRFAPNAPEQNPVENAWAIGKNFLRKKFVENKSFQEVKNCFFNFMSNRFFNFEKVTWYYKVST